MLAETEPRWRPGLYGLMAEFTQPEPLLHAAERAREEGYRHMDAYTPMPVEGLAEAIGFRNNWLARIVFLSGLTGCIGGYALCYWMSVVAYPHNVGGRPLNSWPAYVAITFECTVLLASLSAVIGMLFLNGLPQPYHPVFNVDRFERASRDRFFLCIQSSDPRFDPEGTRKFLQQFSPAEVVDVDA